MNNGRLYAQLAIVFFREANKYHQDDDINAALLQGEAWRELARDNGFHGGADAAFGGQK